VGTAQESGWVQFSVADTGCGMSPEFVRRSLFRPFQTTKKSGLGIGMFHSKTIIEAHQGRVEVQSRPGEGTTFRVFLPTK
jgi:signal transduction histidine kinase